MKDINKLLKTDSVINNDNYYFTYTKWQLTALVLLRVLIGWHFLYEGFAKLLNPDWSSSGYLLDSNGILSGLFLWIAGNQGVLDVVDFLNIWGLIAIGLGLILGFLTRIATVAGIILLSFYYLSHPPFPGLKYIFQEEGNNLIVNKNLIEICALFALSIFHTGNIIGLDRFFRRNKK
jgi:thiosulfate dehydrogenase [quinone] large subunit